MCVKKSQVVDTVSNVSYIENNLGNAAVFRKAVSIFSCISSINPCTNRVLTAEETVLNEPAVVILVLL